MDGVSNSSRSNFVVTTAIEETWEKNDPTVFLGQWCLRHSRREAWSKLDYVVAPYHWDDRSKIPKDLEYISDIYEDLLIQLATKLNSIHGVDHSVRYWRIVVGWWLFYFAQIFYDRWQVMHAAEQSYTGARMLRMPAHPRVPASSDMNEFVLAMASDSWNERLFADVAERWTSIQVEVVTETSAELSGQEKTIEVKPHTISWRRSTYTRMTRFIHWLSRRTVFYGEGIALHSDYLSMREKVKFAVLLRQIPSIGLQDYIPKAQADPSQRKWELKGARSDGFSGALAELIPMYLPTCYLEGYAKASNLAAASGSMRSPRVIMTANAYSSDDRWKMWAAQEVENGAKLVISQHGGHYGTGAWSASQMHEIAISDRYLSWGWSDFSQPRVHPAPATKLIGMKSRSANRLGKCLQVTGSLPRMSYWMYSVPTGPQFESYLDDQLIFANSLSGDVQKELYVRPYSSDYGWDILERWAVGAPYIEIETEQRAIEELLNDTRLYVATYNATTFLESFTQGIPTVMFWDPKLWELSDEALPYFDGLRMASILFDDPVSCARHVNQIWDDVPSWWETSEVQSAVNSFTDNFAYQGLQPLKELKAVLTKW